MKKTLFLFVFGFALSSCVAVKFPNEIRVYVQLPEQISDEQVDRLIDKIPPTLGQRKVKTRVEISSGTGTTVKEEKMRKITATIISP